MDGYRHALSIAAPRTAVFDALATAAGLRGWWTTGAEADEGVGGLTRLRWGPGAFTEFRIDRRDRPGALGWTCVAQHDPNLPRPDEWVGTRVEFALAKADTGAESGTRLALVHHGLEPDLECHDVCARGWDHFLDRSLRGLLEDGRGTPWLAG